MNLNSIVNQSYRNELVLLTKIIVTLMFFIISQDMLKRGFKGIIYKQMRRYGFDYILSGEVYDHRFNDKTIIGNLALITGIIYVIVGITVLTLIVIVLFV